MTNSVGQVISWGSAGKWDLKDRRKIRHMLHKWQRELCAEAYDLGLMKSGGFC
jgi:hypothetical protein